MAALGMLEAACYALQAPPTDAEAKRKRAEAEAVLEHFKRSPTALQDATGLLALTTPPVVLFHCIATIRAVTLQRWPLLSAAERSRPMDLMMQFLWRHGAELPPYVSGAMLQTIVLMMKRGWLDRPAVERQAILGQMGAMMRPRDGPSDGGSGGVGHRVLAAKWVLAFVTEFSSASRASAMHQPIEFHTEARRTLRRGGLKDLVGFAIELLEGLITTTTTTTTTDPTGGQLELLEVAFLLVVEVLNWDFADAMGNLAWSLSPAGGDTGVAEESRPTISPDESWREALVRPALIHAAFNTYAFYRSHTETRHKDNLLHLARQFLIQLASLRGPIFQSKAEHVQFLAEIFRGTATVIHNPLLEMLPANDYAAYEIATRELIDMCQLLFRLVHNIGLQGFLKEAPLQLLSTFLEELSSLSCKLLQSALQKIRAHQQTQSQDAVEDLWQLEGIDILLDAWVALVNDPFLDGATSLAEPVTPEMATVTAALTQLSAPVVELYLQTQLELCAVNAITEQDEDEDVEDDSAGGIREQYELAAALARMNASSSASLLLKILQSLLAETQQCVTGMQGRHDGITPQLSQLYEKIHFIVEFSGLFLADEYAGERPCIPPRIHSTFTEGAGGNSDVINLLLLVMSQLLEFEATRVSENPHSEILSPFVSEQLLSTITRLCATYLAPDALTHATDISPALLNVFGFQEGGRAGVLVNFLVQQSTQYLIHWPTQPVVMENLMDFLLALSKTSAISVVLQVPFWQSLVQANAAAGTALASRSDGTDPLLSAVARVPSTLRGQLTEALCRAGMTADEDNLRHAHFQAIAGPTANRLQHLIVAPNFRSSEFVNDVRVQEELKLIVEMYSGIARSAEAKSHAIISSFSLPALPVMVQIFDIFHGDSQVVYLILRFFCLLVEAQISYLSPKDALQVYNSSHELIRTYCRHNAGRKSIFADAEEESYNDLLALLQLLSHLTSKEFIDFSDHTADAKDVELATGAAADVVFAGLSHVIPMMTEELLQYPSLSKQYFTLVSFMVEVHPDKVARLDARLFDMLVHSLLFGLRHVQVEVAQYSFQAIGELAGFHFRALQNHETGLIAHRERQPEVFVHFIRVILRMAVFEDYNPAILDSCAGALYPLILIEHERYFAIAKEMQDDQPDATIKDRLLLAFQALTSFLSPADLAMGTASTRKHRLLFKSHLFKFVADVRGFIQVK